MVPVLAWAIPCLLPFLSGCDLESYPTELTYPSRSDPIVTQPPGATTWDTFGPGQLDHNIARLPQLEGKTLDPQKITVEKRNEIERELATVFGTPAAPKVKIKGGDDDAKALKLDETTLKTGSKLYRRHCMHCHGVSGDGRGPTGPWVNPTPRDYRQGSFKFLSTDAKLSDRKPRREDLHRTLERGIEGTSMPSFGLLEEDEKEAVVSYIIHLSLRGETEMYTMTPLLDGSGLEGKVRDKIEEVLTDSRSGLLKAWKDSNDKGIEPDAYPYTDTESRPPEASIRRGYRIFTDPKGNGSCIACHVDFGRQAPFRYDRWGTLVRPANLTAGVYRGGRRPLDLYWRIRGGIEPSQMPKADFTDKTANKEQWDKADPYWDLVNFLQALPYPRMLPEDLREGIYGTRRKPAAEHASK
jgi:mono/diheme cytochrome c family protein